MPNLVSIAFKIVKICVFKQTDKQKWTFNGLCHASYILRQLHAGILFFNFAFLFDFPSPFTLLTNLVSALWEPFHCPLLTGFSQKFATQPSLIKPAILQLDFRLVGSQGGMDACCPLRPEGGRVVDCCRVCCATFIKLHFRYAVTFIVLTVCGPTLVLGPTRSHGVS